MSPYRPHEMEAHPERSHRIEVFLHDLGRLFNPMDGSPVQERDLDRDAEEFIFSWAREYPTAEPLTLRIHLAEWPPEDPTELVRAAVHNYFQYRTELNRLELKRLLRRGRTSLVIGLVFLALCLSLSGMISPADSRTWAGLVRESLTIAGWVAMWRPMEIYLYDWWPLRQDSRVYSKLSEIPVEVVRRGGRA